MSTEVERANWRRINAERRKDPAYKAKQRKWRRAWWERNKDNPDLKKRQAAHMRRYRKDPRLRERNMARWILNHRIRAGAVIPQPCVVCGDKAEGHHDDYGRPLDVVWVCREHHTELHLEEARK